MDLTWRVPMRGENERSFLLFTMYCNMGVGRDKKVLRELIVSEYPHIGIPQMREVSGLATAYKWDQRCAEYDKWLEESFKPVKDGVALSIASRGEAYKAFVAGEAIDRTVDLSKTVYDVLAKMAKDLDQAWSSMDKEVLSQQSPQSLVSMIKSVTDAMSRVNSSLGVAKEESKGGNTTNIGAIMILPPEAKDTVKIINNPNIIDAEVRNIVDVQS